MSASIYQLRERVAELNARFRSYDGGDRPMSPPASLIRECIDAERELDRALEEEENGDG